METLPTSPKGLWDFPKLKIYFDSELQHCYLERDKLWYMNDGEKTKGLSEILIYQTGLLWVPY